MSDKLKQSSDSLADLSKLYSELNLTEIVTLNVGGKLFSTTKQTLLSVNDTFFTVLLSGRISSHKDDSGAIFIDRDPEIFSIILNYLRTNHLFKVNEDNLEMLKHEAEFYGITPIVKQLKQYDKLVFHPTCGGDILFQSLLKTQRCSAESEWTQVKKIVPFDNGLVVVFKHHIKCYRVSDYDGWQCVFESEYIGNEITLVDFHFESSITMRCMLAICEKEIILWSTRRFPLLMHNQNASNALLNRSRNIYFKMDEIEEIGRFNLNNSPVDCMFFIGPQLVALSKKKGRVGIWNSSRRWLVQDLKQNNSIAVITAFDKDMSDYLFLCSNHGMIYLIDMQKFPLRMKDGDLLINEFYKDPENEEITAISCYHCLSNERKFGSSVEKSIEIAYGTRSGIVRILVHHPENVGQGAQLFQTIQVHLCAITRIMLNNYHLITICDKLHVRTWSLVRFRGLISTQPGTKPHASFTIHVFDEEANGPSGDKATQSLVDVGPYGNQREGLKQVLIEMQSSQAKYVNILYAANGQKICTLRSVDGSPITSVCIMNQHDVRYRQFIVTGHSNGNVQVWDLTTAMELQPKNKTASREICRDELIKQLFQRD